MKRPFTVVLPLRERPFINPVKKFIDHDTFAAYLQIWFDAGYTVAWTTSHDAVITGEKW